MTERDRAAAILAAINAAISPAVAYEYASVPGTNGNSGVTPAKYVLFDLSRRYVESRRSSGEVSVSGYRLGTRYVAKSVGDARTMRDRVTAALEDQIIAVGDDSVGPFTFESSDAILPDDGGYQSGADVWTF